MTEPVITASKIFGNANRFIEAYHKVLRPICTETGLPPMAVDIMMFFANNPDHGTAKEVCFFRGLKPGIVSVHVDRLVEEGLLSRTVSKDDRRSMQLVCTENAEPFVEKGRSLQKEFAMRLLSGLGKDDIKAFIDCLSVLNDNIEDIRKNGI